MLSCKPSHYNMPSPARGRNYILPPLGPSRFTRRSNSSSSTNVVGKHNRFDMRYTFSSRPIEAQGQQSSQLRT